MNEEATGKGSDHTFRMNGYDVQVTNRGEYLELYAIPHPFKPIAVFVTENTGSANTMKIGARAK